MTTRSAALAVSGLLANAVTTIATVPTGEVWIVKSVYVLNKGVAAADWLVWLKRLPGPINMYIVQESVQANAAAHQDTWVVAEAADQLLALSGAEDGNVWVSGARLRVV
jgi:hypothetical protein